VPRSAGPAGMASNSPTRKSEVRRYLHANYQSTLGKVDKWVDKTSLRAADALRPSTSHRSEKIGTTSPIMR